MKHFQTTKLVAALAIGLSSSYVSAAGFQLMNQNVSGLGNAYAGSAAVADNASTIFYNPAGMTQLKEREFSIGLAVISPSVQFSNAGSSVGGATGFANAGNGGNAGHLAAVPNAYLSWALNKDLYVGVGVGAPFGSKSEYSSPWIGSAQANSFSVETLNINPSVAYRVSDAVSLGAGINWQSLNGEYKRLAGVVDIPAPGGAPIFPQALTTSSTVTAKFKGDSWGWNVGALFTLSPATKLGLSYRSTVSQDTTGDITVTGPTTGGLASAFYAAGTSGAKASLKLPDMAFLSVSHQLDNKWQLLGDISWTGWSSIPKLDLVRTTGARAGQVAQSLNTDFRDAFRVAVGANYRYAPDLTLKAGLAFDQTPVKGETSRLVSMPDNDRTQLAAGAQWALAGGSTLDVGVSYVMIADASINNNQAAAARGIVKGSYNSNAWLMGVQFSKPF